MAEEESISTEEIDEGLAKLAGTMDAGCFACLLSLLNWAKTWQAVTDNTIDGMDGNHARALMLFLTGVGADPFTWSKHGPAAISVLNNEIAQWTGDAVYRDANSMPWLVFSKVGPALSGSSKGVNFGAEAHAIIHEYFTPGEIPHVPDLADVVGEFERRRENSQNTGQIEQIAAGGAKPVNRTNAPVSQRPAGRNQPKSNDPFSRVGASVRRSV